LRELERQQRETAASKAAGPRGLGKGENKGRAGTPGPGKGDDRGRQQGKGCFGKGGGKVWNGKGPNYGKWEYARNPYTYEQRSYEGRENPVGEIRGNEPGIPRGVTRERTELYVRDRATWELQHNIRSQKTQGDGI